MKSHNKITVSLTRIAEARLRDFQIGRVLRFGHSIEPNELPALLENHIRT
jgi:hypothetical protein